jgi:hypothetical protein
LQVSFIEEASVVGSLHFLYDEWGISESDLFDLLALPGREIICEFGGGAQGVVFMAEDGSFVKVTSDLSEVAFAMFLRDRQMQEFPRVHDVYSFEAGPTKLYAIYRESVDDFLDPFDEQHLEDPVIEAMLGAGRSNPPDFTALNRLERISPRHHAEISSLLDSLATMAERLGFGVWDLHADNIGRTDDGRVVVRDFGFNSLDSKQIEQLMADVPELPMKAALPVA